MKRKLLLFAWLYIAVNCSVSASIVVPVKTLPPLLEIGYGVKIPADQLLTLTPKQYRQLTGHRLGITKSIALRIAQKKLKKQGYGGDKSQVAAALLCFFLGTLGIHRFYLGYTWQGIVQLLTLGGLGIWALIDFIRILTGDLQPKDGSYN